MHQTEARKTLKDAPLMWRRINSIGIILDCNSTYATNLGYVKSEIIGKPIFEHVPKESWILVKFMTDAYVMLNCELGAEAEIIEKLKELEQVTDVFETIGTHDMLVKLQADNFEKIREIVSWNIQKLPKVRSTSTLIKKDN